jgi:hypothetical protein
LQNRWYPADSGSICADQIYPELKNLTYSGFCPGWTPGSRPAGFAMVGSDGSSAMEVGPGRHRQGKGWHA